MAPPMENEQSAIVKRIDSFFKISSRGSSISTEIRAGVVTFLTMSYILLVNPQILANAGLPLDKVVASTALTSCLASLFVGLFANLPLGVAPGMGLNAYLVFSQVLGAGISVEVALASCLTAAVVVAVLALIRALSLILHLVPNSIKLAVVVGMGLLLSFIGLQTAHVVVKSEETLVGLGDLASLEVVLAGVGLVLITTLHYRNVSGSILIGVLLTALAFFAIKNTWPTTFMSLPVFGLFKLDFGPILAFDPEIWSAVLAYALVMIFDIGGAMFGLCSLAGLVKDGHVEGSVATYLSAAFGTALGALMGTTPLIVAAESAVGIKEGGRTGLVAVTVSACFGVSLLFAPILQAVPPVATAPVLVLVGAMMIGEAGHIDWTCMPTAVPAFLTMVIQPFTFSIANGIYAGLLFSFILFFTTGDFIPYFRSLLVRSSSELNAAEAVAAADLHASLLDHESGPGHTTPPSVVSRTGSISGAASQATNIVRSMSRRIMHDMAASPAYSSSTHALLITGPGRGSVGMGSQANSPGGLSSNNLYSRVSHPDDSYAGGHHYPTHTSTTPTGRH